MKIEVRPLRDTDIEELSRIEACLLYTSDAADE